MNWIEPGRAAFPSVQGCLTEATKALESLANQSSEDQRALVKASVSFLHAIRQMEREATEVMLTNFAKRGCGMEMEFLRELYSESIDKISEALIELVLSDDAERSIAKVISLSDDATRTWQRVLISGLNWSLGPDTVQ